MKLWGTIRKDNKIQRQYTLEYDGLSRPDVRDWGELIDPLCHELDLSRPIILNKHLREIRDFSRVIFRQDDFMEAVDFDRFEIEIFFKKNKD